MFSVAAVTDYLYKCIFKLVVVHICEGYGFPFTFEVNSGLQKTSNYDTKAFIFLNHLRVELLTWCSISSQKLQSAISTNKGLLM